MANTSIRVDTVGLGIAWQLGETYRVAIDEGFIRQSDGLQLPIRGNTSIMTFSTPATAPQIANTIPTHTSTAPINIQDISFTISRSVGNLTVLGGNVFLNRQGSPNVVVKTYVVSNTNTTGNTVSFSVIGNLEASQTYFITSNANIFLDRDGFKNNAITNSSSFRFISPTAPTVTAFTPGNATVASKNFTNVAIDFDRTIYSNSGSFYLQNANTNAIIRTYNISSALISNNKVTLDVVGNINANGYYYIRSNANVIMDITQIKYPGLTNASTFTFKAPTDPFLESTVPTNTTTSASRSLTTVSFTLDRTVTAVSGNVYLYKQASPNVLLKTWNIGSNVAFNSDRTFTVTVPQGMLAPTQAHYITTDANIAKDLTHINFPGISTTGNTFTFTTDVAPLLSTTFPTYGSALDENESNISFTMDRLVSKNTGNVYLYKIDTVNGNTLVKTYDITANTYLLSNTTVNLPITNLLRVMESYYVNTDFDVLQDFSTNEKFQGIIDANTFVFTTAVDRSYVVDRTALLFPNNIPQITETDTGATYTISLQLSSAIGQIHASSDNFASPTGWTAGTRTYSVTGSKTTVNSALSNLYFFPFAGTSTSATITYSLTKNSVFQKSLVFAITSSANPGYLTGGGNTYTIAEDSKFNFMPFYIYPSWNSNCVVMLKSIQGGNVAIDPGKFYANTASGWTNANDGVIYKSFSRPVNLAVYNSQVAEVRDIYYWLASDYTTSFTIDALLGIESSVSGNTLTGGTVYSVTNTYNITPGGEYSLLTSAEYAEDIAVPITLTISDGDVHPDITYNVQMQQISPDPGLVTGSWTSPGFPTRQWTSVNDTQVKSAWSSVTYYPPQDYTGNILLGTTITKIQPGKANITLASNVATTLTNNTTHNEYEFQENKYYNDLLNGFGLQITDLGSSSYDTYYLSIKQISPDPTVYPANIIIQGTDYGTIANVSGTRADINGWADTWYSYPDYIGDTVFGYTQIKNSYNGNITQASNVAVTYSNYPFANNYSISGGTYIEDADRLIDFTITDADVRFDNYYINVKQISPDPTANVANIILGSSYGSNVTVYANRATINSLTKTITPPADWTTNIVLGYTQIKSTAFGNIIQADNVAITYTNITSHTEYELPITSANVFSNISYVITQTINPQGVTLNNANIELALLGNGNIGSSTIIDTSINGYSMTNTGGVVYSSAVNKWGGTSLYFNGSSRLSIAANTNLEMPDNFTWEAWVYPTGSGALPIISHSAFGRFMIFTNGYWEIGGGSTLLTNGTITSFPQNIWTHFAVTRTSGRVRVFRNGTLAANVTISGSTETYQNLNIGYYPNGNEYFTGYMENIVYLKGQALYTQNFTPINWVPTNVPNINFGVTDQANNKSYSITLSVDNNLANIYQGNVARGTSWTITGTKANVNTLLSNVSLLPGYYGNIRSTSLNYLQTQTTDNIPQANVSIPVTIYPIPPTPIIGNISMLSNIVGNVSAVVSYTAPTPNDAVNYYTATSNDVFGEGPLGAIRTGINITSESGNIVVGNIVPGRAFRLRVNATSSYGNSAYSNYTPELTIYTPPAAPTIGTATAISNSAASISYIQPSYNGGRTITRYTAQSSPGNLIGFVNQSTSGTIIINGLSDSTAYTFTVFAGHLDGNSSVSAASNSITTFANALPSAPTILQAFQEPGNIANIQFTAPTYNGNNTITSYTAVSNVGNITSTISQSGSGYITVGNLGFGNAYTFSIYATNAFGNGLSSSASPSVRMSTDTAIYFAANAPYSFIERANNGTWSPPSGFPNFYTLEMWVYSTDTSDNNRYIFHANGYSDTGLGGYQSSVPNLRQSGTDSWILSGGPWPTTTITGRVNNTWQHLCLQCDFRNNYFFVNGVQRAYVFNTVFNTGLYQDFRIGSPYVTSTVSDCFLGYMDEIRLSNNIAYYGTGTLNGPAAFDPFAVSTNHTPTANTRLLLRGNGTHLSNVITDSSNYSANIKIGGSLVNSSGQAGGSAVGNVWISLGQAKSI
jgi:hypothetical protein